MSSNAVSVCLSLLQVPAGSNAYDALRARLEALTVKLMQGRLGDADSDEARPCAVCMHTTRSHQPATPH
jgi:hypothetical protein